MNQQYPTLNDYAPSWADITTTLNVHDGAQLDVFDYAAMKDGRKIDVGVQKGASGGRVMASTTGELTQDASITLYRSGHRKFLRALMANAPTRGNQVIIGVVMFDVVIQHSPPNSDEIFERRWKGCRFLGDPMDFKEGNEADKIECPLFVTEIVDIIDGKEVVLL
jgi:hypothetical protein